MTEKNFVNPKICRPVLTGNVPRKRLFQKLEIGRKKPITWISSLAGSGKTTLVSSYLEARRLPCLWYLLDKRDGDAATFFHYLGLAARQANPRIRRPLPRFAPEYLAEVSAFTHRYFEGLYSSLKTPSVVVFDNYHKIPAESPVHEIIREGLSLLPRGIHAIFISRDALPPFFARKRASGLVGMIGWKDLRMSLEETRGIVKRWGKPGKEGKTGEIARYLHSRTDGWAAGLVLLQAQASRDGLEPLSASRMAPREIFDYFGAELFNRLGDETREFLLRTAFLPRTTAKMAERLTGNARAGRILSFLNLHNYFTEMYPGDDPVFRYHGLFREFLVSRAEERFHKREISKIRQRAAAVLEEFGLVEYAVGLLRQVGNLEELACVIGTQAPSLIRQGRGKILLDWLTHLPQDTVERNPWLLYWKGVCQLPHNPRESRNLFERSFAGFKALKNQLGKFLAFTGVVDAIVFGGDDFRSLDSWYAELDSLVKETGGIFPSEEIEARVTCCMIKAVSFRRPRSSEAVQWETRARELVSETRDTPVKIEILVNLAYYSIDEDSFSKTEQILQSLKPLLKRSDASPLTRLAAAFAEAAYANTIGQHDRCLEVVTDALSQAEATGVHLLDHLLTGEAALSLLHKGNFPEAKKCLRKMEASLGSARPWETAFFHFLSAWEALHRKSLSEASFHAGQCLTLCKQVGSHLTLHKAHILSAFVSHASGEEKKVAAHLAGARRIQSRTKNRHARFTYLLTDAYLALQKGDERHAVAALREGMHLGRQQGFYGVCLWMPGFYKKLAAKALEEEIETAYVEDLIRKRNLVPDVSSIDLESWPWPVQIYTFGRFGIVRDGKPVPFSRKAQQKPLRMIKSLIALGGREVTEEKMTDVLWPEADGDLGHQSFATNLRRLRKLLGSEKSVLLHEGRMMLNNRYCWVDVWAFERIVGRIDRSMADRTSVSSEIECARLAEKAVRIYRGTFLEGDSFCPCLAVTAERLRSKFLRCVGEAGRYRENAGEWDKAADCYRRGLEVDNLAEEFHRRLMHCHHRVGRDADALAVYHRLRKTLSDVLRVTPSQETEALYRSLRKDQDPVLPNPSI